MSQAIPSNALVVIADGGKTWLFHNAGHGQGIRRHGDAHLTSRGVADGGPSGSRPEEQTPRQTDHATFAKQLVHRLDAMRQRGANDHLASAADPQTLGQMRDAMSRTVADSIAFRAAKVLTNHPAQEIADALG